MREFPVTPKEMVGSLWRNRELILASTKREVIGRYKGSFFGLFWSFFNPIFMLAIYTFVFSVVFNARWGSDTESKTEFALVLFAGLIVFNLFAECVSRAPTLILANPNYVKKVVFPLEILPFVTLLSALYHAFVSLAIWLVAYSALVDMPHITVLLLPVIVVPFAAFVMGVSWALASFGVFLRDVSQVVGVLVTCLMFLSPIFYPVSAIPERYQYLLHYNPLTTVIEVIRSILYWGNLPDFATVATYWLVTGFISWLGFAWFQKTRKGFADVL
jgi:lipopolysaccharide transport system permease protein